MISKNLFGAAVLMRDHLSLVSVAETMTQDADLSFSKDSLFWLCLSNEKSATSTHSSDLQFRVSPFPPLGSPCPHVVL